MAGKKKPSLADALMRTTQSTDEYKAGKAMLKGAAKLVPGGALANAAAKWGQAAGDYLETGMTASERKDYIANMGSKAWAKEKKKAGIKD